MKRKKSKSIGKPETQQPMTFHTDGSGARPDGKGSAVSWVREDTDEEYFESVDGLTNNQAEYRAIISALESARAGSTIKILSDSQLVTYQILGKYRVNDGDLSELRNRVNQAIVARDLKVTFEWIPRGQNRADKVLQRKKMTLISSSAGVSA